MTVGFNEKYNLDWQIQQAEDALFYYKNMFDCHMNNLGVCLSNQQLYDVMDKIEWFQNRIDHLKNKQSV